MELSIRYGQSGMDIKSSPPLPQEDTYTAPIKRIINITRPSLSTDSFLTILSSLRAPLALS